MVAPRAHVACELLESARNSSDPSADAMRALLDHLAEELAREYVHLMKKAAEDERLAGNTAR